MLMAEHANNGWLIICMVGILILLGILSRGQKQ